MGLAALACFALTVPLEVVTLTVSDAVMPPPPAMVNVHVGPAATGVTVKVAPDCAIVATLVEHVVPLTENVPLYPLCDAVVLWLFAVPAA